MFEAGSVLEIAHSTDASILIELARSHLGKHGVAAVPVVLNALVYHDLASTPDIQPVLIAALSQFIQAFDADPYSPSAYAALGALTADFASLLFDLSLESAFGTGSRDVRLLNLTGKLCLIGLLSAAGAHEQAAALLAEIRAYGVAPTIGQAAWFARCRWAGCDSAVESYWRASSTLYENLQQADACISTTPFELEAHRTRARLYLIEGNAQRALRALTAALALPVGDSDKMKLAGDFAALLPLIAARGEQAFLRAERTRWALADAPNVTLAIAAAIETHAASDTLPFLDPAEAAELVATVRGCVIQVNGSPLPPVTAFPLRNGKPHADTVWLEITNHCNQKCTFCPDMFREDARTWMPLERVKLLIDQLADTVSVGSMQLNAYGEPLLHPNFGEILRYLRERVSFPTFFTTHGMTLVDKKLKQLSGNYPTGIAVSLHNDSEESYRLTRSQKIGDYETLVSRVAALVRQMANERAPSHVRLYQMVVNGRADGRVDAVTRSGFPDTPERLIAHVRKWEAIAAEIAAAAPPEAQVQALYNDDAYIQDAFQTADHADSNHIRILSWVDVTGTTQYAFMWARPVSTYANLLLEYDPRWSVERKLVNKNTCGFTRVPSLAIFASGRLGLCCLDLNSTATFGDLADFTSLKDALTSRQALRMFAQISNGVAVSKGCQICLGGSERLCESNRLPGPMRPAGHFPEGI